MDSLVLMMMCDIDFFKVINDDFGYFVGDEVLMNFVFVLWRFKCFGDFVG